jgi:hemerythrin
MNKITWKDEYSIGHEKIDDQHKKIVDLINELDESDSPEITTSIISKVNGYVRQHLDYEEQLLKSLEYPEFEQHKELHTQYAKEISNLTVKATFLDDFAPGELLEFLKKWWDNHILVEDKKYKNFIHNKLNLTN